MKMDWLNERSHLKFIEVQNRVAPELANSWKSTGFNSSEFSALNPCLRLEYKGQPLAESYIQPSLPGTANLGFRFAPNCAESEFIQISLFRVSLLYIERELDRNVRRVFYNAESGNLPLKAKDLGFTDIHSPKLLQRDISGFEPKSELKKFLLSYSQAAPQIGRGFLIDAERLDQRAVAALNNEYSEVAWGVTNWARHSSLSCDEQTVIARYARGSAGLEVGAGSGRVTQHLKSNFDLLTATDTNAEALEHFSHFFDNRKNIRLAVDDITNSSLDEESFDVVMFWENGLGALTTDHLRRKAVASMVARLKKGGRLILGLRNILPVPIDHLMIAAQTSLVMGIYHTFSVEEALSFQSFELKLIDQIEGDPRPAGGRQIVFVFERGR